MVQAVALLNNSDSDIVQREPRSAKRVVGHVLGGVVLLLSGVAIGRQHASSLRGSSLGLIGEDIRTRAEYETAYRAYTQGMNAAALSAANSKIYDSSASPVGPTELVALNSWFKAVSTPAAGVDSKWAEQMMNTAFVNLALPVAAVAPAKQATPTQVGCSTSISSYTEFGHCYSHATAGRPWAHIASLDKEVRGATLPVGSSTEIRVLWSWYQHHASVAEKHDFENSALVHEKSAASS